MEDIDTRASGEPDSSTEGGAEVANVGAVDHAEDPSEHLAESRVLRLATAAIERALERQAGFDSDRIERAKARMRERRDSQS